MDHEKLKDIRVLLIDDDEDDFLIIKSIFGKIPDTPFKLDWEPDYEKAKSHIKSDSYDAFLVDYQLGANTGLDLLTYAEPAKRPQPFILLTGAGDKRIEWRSMELAASDYLVKGTFDAQLLSRTLYYALQRKKIEQQRIEELLELNRSKDEFISIASHQLRTPATGVKQYIGMLLEGFVGKVTDEQQEMLEKAYESNERQLRIVSDLLKVAQIDAGRVSLKKTDTSVNDLIADVVNEQKDTFASRDQKIVFVPAESDKSIFVDKGTMRMVLENVIDNAGKYSHNGTVVNVSVSEREGYVCIDTEDQGVGIDPKDTPRLYQKFSRLYNPMSTSVGGTGLGLYWAKKIVDLHGGKISHRRNAASGTTFTICLPKL